jgi:predicted amidohydrolase YtcJ
VNKIIPRLLVPLMLVACGVNESPPVDPVTESTPAPAEVADSIYTNGKIYTVAADQSWAEAVAIKDGKFLRVGGAQEIEPLAGPATEVVDLEGRLAVPGFINAHTHPLSVANGWANLQIENPADADAIVAQVKAFAEANPELEAIRGEAWNLGVFEGNSPRKELLDAVVPDRPVYLMSQTGHSAWANSVALERAGITRDTEQTATFLFDADAETGEPTGTVREFGMGAIEQTLPLTSLDRYAAALGRIAKEFNEYGFTTVKAAEGAKLWVDGAKLLEEQGGLTFRVFVAWDWALSHYLTTSVQEADANIENWESYASELIYPRYVKLFYDGGPDSYTAALFEDYVGRPGHTGSSNRSQEEFTKIVAGFNSRGIGVLAHVLGDRGGEELAEVFARVRKQNGDNGIPLHFSHAWLTRPEVYPRLAELSDVCVDFSPALNYPHPAIEGSMAEPLGDERYQTFFNVRSAIESGVPVGLGDDWASALIPEPNALHQIQSWVTRKDPDNPQSGTLNADQAITVEQAVTAMTLGGAQCLGFGWDEKLGSIEAGKLADMVVLQRNIFEIPTDEIDAVRVERTLLGGKIVYDRPRDGDIDYIDTDRHEPTSRYLDGRP